MVLKQKGSPFQLKTLMWTNWGPLLKRQQASKRGYNFGWEDFCVYHSDWSRLSLESRWNSDTHVKPTYLERVLTIPILCALHHGIHFTTKTKSTINLNQGSRKVPVRQDSECRHGHLFDRWPRHVCRSWSPLGCFMKPGSTIDQGRYLLSCQNKGFNKSANLSQISRLQFCCGWQRMELSILMNMCVASVPRLMVAIKRNFDWSDCSLVTCVSSSPPDGKCKVYQRTDELLYSRAPIVIDSPLLFRRGSNTTSLSAAFWVAQVSHISRDTTKQQTASTHCTGSPRSWTGQSGC